MVKKRAKKEGAGGAARKRRKRRSEEEIIADLQAEIQRLREKKKVRELKESPSLKAGLAAIKSLDKALKVATDENDSVMRHVLAESRKTLGLYLEKQGASLPKADLPKGPKPRELKELGLD